MNGFNSFLQARLEELAGAHLRRELRPVTRSGGAQVSEAHGNLVSFASNDYLGLADHPAVRAAAAAAAREHGAGSTASRLICGSLAIHHTLEARLAAFKQTPAALSFASGYATALGVIPALVGPGDFILLDRLAHACLVDGARLSGARLRVFKHNDPTDLERLLRWTQVQREAVSAGAATHPAQVLIVTESVFSMDGDRAPLPELVRLKDQYAAWLMVDEAHATGVIGPRRSGLIEEHGVTGRVEIAMGTLGKALGSAGGFIAGSRALQEFLVHRARSLVFSTAPAPAAVGAALAALEVVQGAEGERLQRQLGDNLHAAHTLLTELGWTLAPAASPILPLHVGAEEDALRLAAAARAAGLWIPAIRYPTVQRGRARLRVSLSAAHTAADLEHLRRGLVQALKSTGITPR